MIAKISPTLLVLLLAYAPTSFLFCADEVIPPTAEEKTADPKPDVSDVGNAEVRTQAESKAAAGRKALQTYRKDQAGNPNAVVDAAVAFTEAHKLYSQLNDTDSVSEMQANIFWCKKQMNLDAVKLYLTKEGKTDALAQMNEVADKKVEINEGKAYLDRAKKFAAEHGDDLNGVSIRYFEVAERFVGTPIGLEAQKLSLEAQNKYMQYLQSGGLARDTRFTKPAVVNAGARVAIPDEKAQKATITDLKKLYAKDYGRRTDAQKRRFAAKLADEAAKSKGDATTYFTTLSEVCRLAQEAEDYERLLDTIDLLASSFTGYEAAEQKKLWLKKMTGKTTAGAISTLLDNPKDAAANTLAGKFFCFELKRWSEGLNMLAICSDVDLKAVAEQELSNPTEESQFVQVGDAWYSFAKKGSNAAEKFSMLARSQHWYLKPKALTGVLKERVNQRLTEIDKTLPLDLDNIDFENLTPTQWSKLKGAESVIPVRAGRTGPVATMKPGQRFRVVPNPADTWTCQSWLGATTCTAAGTTLTRKSRNGQDGITTTYLLSYQTPYPNYRFGELLVQVDKADPVPCGVIDGPGNVWIIPNAPSGERKGQIRIKLVAVDDE